MARLSVGMATAATLALLSSGLGMGSALPTKVAAADASIWNRLIAQPGSLSLSDAYPTVGQADTLIASGLPAGSNVAVLWQTVHGAWQVDGPTFIGAHYTYGVRVLTRAKTTPQGSLTLRFTIPSGYGGQHLLGVELPAGRLAAVTSATVIPSLKLAASRVPEGGFFEFTMRGVGYQPYFSQFPVTYDNRLTGNVTAVSTQGTAHFAVRAEGVGPHQIVIYNGTEGAPYLNIQQSPFAFMPTFSFPVTVLAATPRTVSDALPRLNAATGGKLVASPASGVVGASYTLIGHGLAPVHRYTLTWWTTKGSHVSGRGYGTLLRTMGTVTTTTQGTFRRVAKVPPDLGGPAHRITLTSDGKLVATTQFRIFPKLVAVTPNPAPEGSLVTITLLGGGWTYYDNIYSVDYDNGFVGFGCAFNSQGDLQIQLRATGRPGVHFIDLYPSIWKGRQTLPNPYLLPQLTYNRDHPGDWIPSFHLLLRVTPARPRRAG